MLGFVAQGFYRSQFWRLQKLGGAADWRSGCFIGHNFGDYKNNLKNIPWDDMVLSVTILETTKTFYFFALLSCLVLSVTILETTKTSNGIS